MNNVTGILNKMLSFLKIKKKRKLKAKEWEYGSGRRTLASFRVLN
jgi:hypothetical protein